MRAAFILLSLLLLLNAAKAADEPPMSAMTRQAVEKYIEPAYRELTKSTADLAHQVGQLCAAETERPIADILAPVVAAWSRVEFLRFGPITDQNRYERFSFWPDPKGTGPRQLRQFLAAVGRGEAKPENVSGLSAAIQGLPALEMLLAGDFGKLRSAEGAGQRCAAAAAIAGNMAAIAHETEAEWVAYRDILLKPGADNPLYRSDKEAATEILKALSTGFQQLREQRISPALGKSATEAKPRRLPYYRSRLTLAYVKSSVDGLQGFAEASGITSLLPPESGWIAASIVFEFQNLDRTLAKLSGDGLVEEAKNRQGMSYGVIVLNSLQDLFAIGLAGAVGLSPGFNALDGD